MTQWKNWRKPRHTIYRNPIPAMRSGSGKSTDFFAYHLRLFTNKYIPRDASVWRPIGAITNGYCLVWFTSSFIHKDICILYIQRFDHICAFQYTHIPKTNYYMRAPFASTLNTQIWNNEKCIKLTGGKAITTHNICARFLYGIFLDVWIYITTN